MKKNNTYQDWSDQKIIDAFKESQDQMLIGELYNRYHGMVYGVSLKYLQNKTMAKDMVMKVFEDLFEKLKTNKIDQFHSWLYVVVKNYCLMYHRKKKIQTKDIDNNAYKLSDYNEELLEKKKEHDDLLNKMEALIEHLKDDQKKCIQLFYLEQKSYQSVQEITGLSYKEVKSAIQNGKRNLRILMTKS